MKQQLLFENPLERAAREWMEDHPEAMALFERLALQAAERGCRFGIGLLTERIRWEFAVERGVDGFKINNNHRAYIARELLRRHPRLRGFLETRKVGG